jgi:PilZ domain-containing protein
MRYAPESSIASIPPSKKSTARVALVDLKETARLVLSDCFKQLGMEVVPMTDNVPDRVKREKFEACVLRLVPDSGPVMDAARSSPSNQRMVICGLGGTAQDALKFSKYGVNAVFHEPLERAAVLKLVRATRMLVFHEFRRYVRVPVITEISLTSADGRRFVANSQEISSGGMSLKSNEDLPPGMAVELSFALLTLPRIWVKGYVSWRKAASKTFGIRYDPKDDRRLRIKEWVEAYLEC